jgi:hypothetical protein
VPVYMGCKLLWNCTCYWNTIPIATSLHVRLHYYARCTVINYINYHSISVARKLHPVSYALQRHRVKENT